MGSLMWTGGDAKFGPAGTLEQFANDMSGVLLATAWGVACAMAVLLPLVWGAAGLCKRRRG